MSNLSYMKRVMMLVFPTDWSPKNTNLYLAKGDTDAILLWNSDRIKKRWNQTLKLFFYSSLKCSNAFDREKEAGGRRSAYFWKVKKPLSTSTRTASEKSILPFLCLYPLKKTRSLSTRPHLGSRDYIRSWIRFDLIWSLNTANRNQRSSISVGA